MAQGSLSDKHVLIVEDEIYVALDLQTILAEGGATTAHAESSADAIALLQGSHFDVAVLDVHLRDGNTYSVADELRKLSIPFVFLSGYLTVREGYTDVPFLAKPHTADLVRTAIGALLAARL
jgi:CheY-like chemotaxis protein